MYARNNPDRNIIRVINKNEIKFLDYQNSILWTNQ